MEAETATLPAVEQFRAKDDLFTPSNIISAMRAVMVFPAIFGIVGHMNVLTAAVCITAFLSDLLDGYLARKLDSVSEFGKIIDPLADKIYVGLLVITMAAYGLVPVWFLAVVLVRDIIIVAVGVWAKRKLGVVLPSNYPGKLAVLTIALTLFLLVCGVTGNGIVFLEWASVAGMTLSLILYGRRLAQLLRPA